MQLEGANFLYHSSPLYDRFEIDASFIYNIAKFSRLDLISCKERRKKVSRIDHRPFDGDRRNLSKKLTDSLLSGVKKIDL